MVNGKDVLDFKNWWSKHYKKTCLSIKSCGRSTPRAQKESFAISSFMEFRYDHTRKGIVEASKFFDGFQTSSFVLRNANTDTVSLPIRKTYGEEKLQLILRK